MADYTIFKMANMSPLHIGTGKENYDFSASDLQSDTLSAALAAIRVQQGKNSDIKEFLSSFTVSSAFPYWKNYYFLPKIQGKMKVIVANQDEHEYRKKLKKIRFVESSLWQKLANDEEIIVNENQIQKEFLLPILDKKETFSKIFKSQVSERVSVPRGDGQEATPFFFDWKYFSNDSGLYCLVDAKKETISEIKNLFEMLGVEGIGTDKNIGGGKFDVNVVTQTIDEPKESNATMLLSLFIPNEDEFKNFEFSKSKYNITLRGGYMSGSTECDFRHLRKKSIYMFEVGSVFPNVGSLKGKIVNLRPEWNDELMHDVYRSGRPFYLPIKI